MTCYIISSEHDMEAAIDYTLKVTKQIKGRKRLGFSFPSDQLSHIFLTNLAATFIKEGVPIKNNLEIDIFVPEDGPDIDDGDMFDEDEY